MMHEKSGVELLRMGCPSCGANLEIGRSLNRFACGHCGNEFLVNRGGGVIALEPVVEHLIQVKQGVDRTAAELAITRLKGELNSIDQQYRNIQSRCVSPLPWKGMLIAVFVALFFLTFGLEIIQKSGAIDSGFLYLGVAIVIGVVLVMMIRNHGRTALRIENQKKTELPPLQALYQQKTKELEHHQQVVSL